MLEVRPLAAEEYRAAHALFRAALHRPPMSADQWEHTGRSFEPGRTLGAFADGVLVGTALAWSSDIVVPGGAVLPMAAVTRVGVRADFRRRGVLRALMAAQAAEMAGRGEVFAGLHATEPTIYGRFGYGVATRAHEVVATGAALRPGVTAAGSVRVIAPGDTALFDVYAKAGRARVGSIARPPQMWANYERAWAIDENIVTAVHTGPDGDDGFVTWRPAPSDDPARLVVLSVEDCAAATPAVAFALWEFLLGLDLVDRVRFLQRPTDEPLSAAVLDPRTVAVDAVRDDLWLRVLDVPAALAARTYRDGAPAVIEVVDDFRPANSGRYRVSAQGVERTEAPAEVSLPVDVLSMAYLGAWTWCALVEAGRVQVLDPAAPARLDRLFAVDRAPFTGTFF